MPEGIEVEQYRALADRVVGRRIVAADLPDTWYVKGSTPEAVEAAIVGRVVERTRRRGKLLMLDLSDAGPVLGLRFGMTGRLVVDGVAGIDQLQYGSSRDEPTWRRATLHFDRAGPLVMLDPRRLGSVELDPAEHALGPDAATITTASLTTALAGSRAPLKAALLDQGRIAGLGNLLVDETLWRLGVSPLRLAGTLDPVETAALARTIRGTFRTLTRRGGSHTGDLMDHRGPGGVCPRDGAALRRDTVGGRTTWWCPLHQV